MYARWSPFNLLYFLPYVFTVLGNWILNFYFSFFLYCTFCFSSYTVFSLFCFFFFSFIIYSKFFLGLSVFHLPYLFTSVTICYYLWCHFLYIAKSYQLLFIYYLISAVSDFFISALSLVFPVIFLNDSFQLASLFFGLLLGSCFPSIC